jgi:hypothetical protein
MEPLRAQGGIHKRVSKSPNSSAAKTAVEKGKGRSKIGISSHHSSFQWSFYSKGDDSFERFPLKILTILFVQFGIWIDS